MSVVKRGEMRSENIRRRNRQKHRWRYRASFSGHLLFGLAMVAQFCLLVSLLHGAAFSQQQFLLRVALVLSLVASVCLSVEAVFPKPGGAAKIFYILLAWLFFLFDFLVESLLF